MIRLAGVASKTYLVAFPALSGGGDAGCGFEPGHPFHHATAFRHHHGGKPEGKTLRFGPERAKKLMDFQ